MLHLYHSHAPGSGSRCGVVRQVDISAKYIPGSSVSMTRAVSEAELLLTSWLVLFTHPPIPLLYQTIL